MRKLLVLLAACSVVVACDTRISGVATSFSAEVGTYVLTTYNAKAVPAALPDTVPGTTLVLQADTVLLSVNGNVRESRWISSTKAPAAAVITSSANAGRYTITGDSLGFTGITLRAATLTSTTLTATDPQGFVYVFTRR